MTEARKHLNDFRRAARNIELAETAINLLELVDGMQSAIKIIKQRQYAQLQKMDAAAEKLGAPYPKKDAS